MLAFSWQRKKDLRQRVLMRATAECRKIQQENDALAGLEPGAAVATSQVIARYLQGIEREAEVLIIEEVAGHESEQLGWTRRERSEFRRHFEDYLRQRAEFVAEQIVSVSVSCADGQSSEDLKEKLRQQVRHGVEEIIKRLAPLAENRLSAADNAIGGRVSARIAPAIGGMLTYVVAPVLVAALLWNFGLNATESNNSASIPPRSGRQKNVNDPLPNAQCPEGLVHIGHMYGKQYPRTDRTFIGFYEYLEIRIPDGVIIDQTFRQSNLVSHGDGAKQRVSEADVPPGLYLIPGGSNDVWNVSSIEVKHDQNHGIVRSLLMCGREGCEVRMDICAKTKL